MKKFIIRILVLLVCGILVQSAVNGQETQNDLSKDRAAIEAEKEELKRQWADLKSFQVELEQRAGVLEKEKKELEEREARFRERLENESVNKKVIESYESIDPEQAAPLVISLFKENENLAVLLMRKMTPKKAGKIMEAMIPMDRGISTKLAQKTLTYYSEREK